MNSGKRVFAHETFPKFSLFKNNLSKTSQNFLGNHRAICIKKMEAGCIVDGYVSVCVPDAYGCVHEEHTALPFMLF